MLTSENVDEIADTQPGVVLPGVTLSRKRSQTDSAEKAKSDFNRAPRMSTASIGTDGKVVFEPN